MLTQSILKELLHYNPDTGIFTWKHRDQKWFKTYRSFCSGNARYAEKVAGVSVLSREGKRYIHIMALGKDYLAHRIAWVYISGEWPEDEIDHIDGNGENNKLINIRSVSRLENNKNKRLPSTNKSGVMGVHWHKRDQHWRAEIKVKQKTINLGGFKDINDAIKARKAAEFKYGFHKNHGSIRPL
jgi:hypothetical protein